MTAPFHTPARSGLLRAATSWGARLGALLPRGVRRERVVHRRARAVERSIQRAIVARGSLSRADARGLLEAVEAAVRVLPRSLEPRAAARLERDLERGAARLAAFLGLDRREVPPRIGPAARRLVAGLQARGEAALRDRLRSGRLDELLARLEAEANAARGAVPSGLRSRSLCSSVVAALAAGIAVRDARLLSCLFGRAHLLRADPRLTDLCAQLRRRAGRLEPTALQQPVVSKPWLGLEPGDESALSGLRARLTGRRVLVIAERPSLRRAGILETLLEGARLEFADPRPGGRFGEPSTENLGQVELVLELARAGAGLQTELLAEHASALPWVRVAPGLSAARLVRELTLELVDCDV